MSKILSEEREEVVYKIKRKVTGVECDKCGKVIHAPTDYQYNGDPKYFRVMTGHHDWGNDSCESVRRRDICPGCITKFVADYVEKTQRSYTAFIEIESKRVDMNEYEYE